MHVSTFSMELQKFSSELELACPSVKLFHLEQFAIYGMPCAYGLYHICTYTV